MEFNLDEMTAEELDELLKQIQAKLEQIANPKPEEEREGEEEVQEAVDNLTDDLDELEELIDKIEDRKAAIKSNAEKRASLIRKLASGEAGVKVRTFEEENKKGENKMENEMIYRSAWLKNLQGRDITAEERTALAGGNYAIPQETLNKIVGKMELYPLLNAVDVMHIPGTVEIPVEGTVNAAAVVAMGTAAIDSADTIGHVNLGVYKMIKTVEITADVAAMAIPAFEDWLTERLANKMYRLATSLIAAGTGTNQPTGLHTITAMSATYTAAGITFDDVLAIIAALPTEYLPNASFVMPRTLFWQGIMAIKDGENRPIVVQDPQSPAKYNILGFPVILEDSLSNEIVFGDLKEGYAWNFGKDITIDRDESVGFRAGSTVFRGMCLGDGKPTGVGLVRCAKGS